MYQFNSIPFGLKQIPSHFQRVMRIVLRGCEKYARVYLDDIVIFSKTFKELVQHVREIILQMTKINMPLQYPKCYFVYKSVALLGSILSENGLAVQAEKIANIQEWPFPKTGKQMQSFLGMVNYIREHLPKLSDLTSPLDELRSEKKITADMVTTRRLQCFENLKQLVSSPIVLKFPDYSKPFIIATDASDVGMIAYQDFSHQGI